MFDYEIKSQVYLLCSLIQKIQQNTPIIYKNVPEKKVRQSSVALFFRVNPKFKDHIDKKMLKLHEREFYLDYLNLNEILVEFTKNIVKNKTMNIDSSSPPNIFDFLLIQRSVNIHDSNSGQLALPGGKCDFDETDFEALVREVREEIGLDLAKNIFYVKYLGKLNKNFFFYKNKKETIFSTLGVFLVFDNFELIMNKSEVQDYRWIPTNLIMNLQKEAIKTKSFYMPEMTSFFRIIFKYY